MSSLRGNLAELVDRIRRKAPEYLDLLTARTDEEFEQAFDGVLEKAISHLEANKANFNSLDEAGLSAALAGRLSIPGLTASLETHSNGHVDITIDADHCVPARKKLAEAKIYDGPEYHFQGLQQLLGRYTTGRERRGILVVYVRKANIAGLFAKLRARMDQELPLDQRGPTRDHLLKWSFRSTHHHACGDDLEVGHVGCNLYVEPGARRSHAGGTQ